MKFISFLFVLTCTLSTAFSQSGWNEKTHFFNHQPSANRQQGTFIYNLTTSSEPYTDLTGATSVNNGEIWDDPEYFIGLPFDFLLNETVVDGLQLYGLGGLLRAPTSEPDVYTYVIPFEVDLLDRGELEGIESLSPISYKVDGSPGNRIFKLEFKNAGSYLEYYELETMDMFINFQMWLYEGSNTIQFRFGPSFIDNPFLFYEELSGAAIGTVDFNDVEEIFSNVHLLTGVATDPVLTATLLPIDGTPPDGIVYTLSMGTPISIELTAQNNTSYCEPNGSVESEVTGGLPPYTYEWSNGATTPDLMGLSAGTYTLTVTDMESSTATASVIVINSVDPMTLETMVTHETAEDANDGTATVVASDGLPPYTYLWSNGQTTATIEDLAPGTYTVTVTDNTGCSESAEVVINPFGCPELFLETTMTDISCNGICDATISIVEVQNGVAPFDYEWSHGDTDATAESLCPGNYEVTVTDNDNCIVIGSWSIVEPAALIANASATAETITGANDGTATSNPEGGIAPYSFLWSNGGMTSQITGLAPGMYSVIVTDSHNCMAFDTVTIEEGPCAILTATVTDVTCYGYCDGSIQINGVWATILWSTGSSSFGIDQLCAGDYSVTATDASGCTVVDTFTIDQPDPLIANTGSTNETIEGGDGTAWVVPEGGTPPYAYLWSNGSTDSLITNLVADVYSVTLTDVNGCADTSEVEVDEFICFIISENEVQHVFCHDSCDGLIFVVPLGGVGPYEYEWSNGDTSNIVFDLCAGWYSVTVTDLGQNNCSSFIDIEILQPDSFYFTIDNVIHLSDTSSASVDVSFYGGTPPYVPVWFGPNGFVSFDEDLSDISPGTYTLNLFDSNDCSITDSVQVLDMTTALVELPEDEVSIYPNPVTSFLHVEQGFESDYVVSIYSVLGKTVGIWKNARVIDVMDLAAGIYLVRFENAEGFTVRKIIVER